MTQTTISNMQAAVRPVRKPALNYTLWTIQVLLAALFLFAGVMKLMLPIAAMTQQIALPGWFLRFIGMAEVAGGLGLILPGALRIRKVLTPVAAAGLVVIMTGATALSAITGPLAMAAIPLVAGILAATVAYQRWERPDTFHVQRETGLAQLQTVAEA